ncbi:MAG: hypothetical protein BWY80_00308 [Firmicutes bacterium ADurb.Bin456]|nr:MAG: hypothetical protein BWY80_00308 [Firmicutes bacterium ADurb.Bin456]
MSAVPFKRSTPWTPAASAERMMVPRFPGSCMPSSKTSRAGPSGVRVWIHRSAKVIRRCLSKAIIPWGESVSASCPKRLSSNSRTRIPPTRAFSRRAAPRRFSCRPGLTASSSTGQSDFRASSTKRIPSTRNLPSCSLKRRMAKRRRYFTRGLCLPVTAIPPNCPPKPGLWAAG